MSYFNIIDGLKRTAFASTHLRQIKLRTTGNQKKI